MKGFPRLRLDPSPGARMRLRRIDGFSIASAPAALTVAIAVVACTYAAAQRTGDLTTVQLQAAPETATQPTAASRAAPLGAPATLPAACNALRDRTLALLKDLRTGITDA